MATGSCGDDEVYRFQKVDFDGIRRPRLPSGDDAMLLSEAVDEIGRSRFGDEWTGDEIYSHPVADQPAQIALDAVDRVVADAQGLPKLSGGSLTDLSSFLRWHTNRLLRSTADADPSAPTATARVSKVDLEYWQAWFERSHAYAYPRRTRFEGAREELHKALATGELRSWAHHTSTGKVVSIPSEFWSVAPIDVFETKKTDPFSSRSAGANTMKTAAIEGRVFLSRKELSARLGGSDSMPDTETAVTRARQRLIYTNDLEELHRKRVENSRLVNGSPPTIEDDETWAREIGITQKTLRKLRAAHLNEQEKRGGKPRRRSRSLG